MNDLRLESVRLRTFGSAIRACVAGASGGLGRAFVEALAADPSVASVVALSRSNAGFEADGVVTGPLDIGAEASIASAADLCQRELGGLDLLIVATGILHDGAGVQPEKSWRDLDGDTMARVFEVNTIGPALVGKHFLPLLPRRGRAAAAFLSARVGSISDNHLGGWHSYRASKAALNMVVRNFAIELGRRNRDALCVGLHPGTVDTALSEPFQGNVPAGKLFQPHRSAGALLGVLDGLGCADSGGCFAWDGQRVPA